MEWKLDKEVILVKDTIKEKEENQLSRMFKIPLLPLFNKEIDLVIVYNKQIKLTMINRQELHQFWITV